MGKLLFCETSIKGVMIVKPQVFGDSRGYFMESYNRKDFLERGLNIDFVQDNQSASHKGVLRGLHYQKKHSQTKLVRVLQGDVFDVVVDLREKSETYGKWFGIVLSGENMKQLLIPKGFAHGFVVLSDYAEFAYKCDDYYHPEDEGGIIWNDPDVAIDWPFVGEFILSEKDKKNPSLRTSKIEFNI